MFQVLPMLNPSDQAAIEAARGAAQDRNIPLAAVKSRKSMATSFTSMTRLERASLARSSRPNSQVTSSTQRTRTSKASKLFARPSTRPRKYTRARSLTSQLLRRRTCNRFSGRSKSIAWWIVPTVLNTIKQSRRLIKSTWCRNTQIASTWPLYLSKEDLLSKRRPEKLWSSSCAALWT